jgi:hypothetical protein
LCSIYNDEIHDLAGVDVVSACYTD